MNNRPPQDITEMRVMTKLNAGTCCIIVAMIAASWTLPRIARCADQVHKLTAQDVTEGDSFGYSVAVNDDTAIVGAPRLFKCGASGAAYVFDVTTGKTRHTLTSDDATKDDQLGFSVAISGGTVIVGTPQLFKTGGHGSAYLFDAATGAQQHKLEAVDGAPHDHFGISVGISGKTAIVGSRLDDDAGHASGSAYLFDVATGRQLHKLIASDATAGDKFGQAVAIGGDVAIVGSAPGFFLPGSAYVFDVATGKQLHKLTPDDSAPGNFFGSSLAVSGTTAIVGCLRDHHAGHHSGSAYLFDVTTGKQRFKLTAKDALAYDHFGTSVAISGTTAVVGSLRNDQTTGSAYLYDVRTGRQLSKFTAPDAMAGHFFGTSVGIGGNTVIVGSRVDELDAFSEIRSFTGAAYLFAFPNQEHGSANGR